ncbi:MAG: hypothetical protein U1E25_06260 [Methylocystis sp.]
MAGDDKPNKFAELASALAVIGAIVGAPIAFLKTSGLADDLGAAYGVATKDLTWVVACGAALAIAFVFLWYFETLGGGAEAAGSGLRERFDRETARLVAYRVADDSYAQKLKAFLAWIDRFFDGESPPSQRARILTEPAHVWTAASYDRCLLLALLYPIVVIFISWTIAGHVGPAESALGLKQADEWLRIGIASAVVLYGVSVFKLGRTVGMPETFWDIAVAFASVVAFAFALMIAGVLAFVAPFLFLSAFAIAGDFPSSVVSAFAGVFASAFAVASAAAVARAFASFGAVAVGFAAASAVGLAFAAAFESTVAVAVAISFAVAVAIAIALLSSGSKNQGLQAVFLGGFSALNFALCLLAARMLSRAEMAEYFAWDEAKPFLLFLGLFTLINAPFDWLSLGLTRLLLRYGIEKGGYWPYALAIVDAVVASVLITILALAMAWSNDLFNFLAAKGGGAQARVLPPSSFYLGMLERDPAAPEFWWLYATLFSTMIPSVINLFIAGFSFLRTLPWSRNFLLLNMREGETMPVAARLISSSILTAQVALAWPLAVAAQVFLTYVVLWQIMPRLGLGILHLVETLSL